MTPPNHVNVVITYLTRIRTLKQLFITIVLISNIMTIFDLVFNQGQGLNSLIDAYLAVYPGTDESGFYLADQDLQFLKDTLEPYPDAKTSVYELTHRNGILPVARLGTANHIVLYTGGIPSVIIALDPSLPDPVTQSIFVYFKGYENFSSPLFIPAQ